MDEGDRSGEDDGPDRETGSADSDVESDDSAGSDPATGNGPTAGDGSTGGSDRDSGEGAADDPAAVGSGDETESDGSGNDETESDGSGNDGTEADRATTEADRATTEADREVTGARRPELETNQPEPEPRGNQRASDGGVLYRFRHDREGPLMWIREMLSSVAIVLVIGLILFGVSGVWPPMVAVESGSMEPNMEVGDLVFVTEPGRLAPDAADNDIGVVTHEVGEQADYRTFGSYGSVVIYRPPGRTASPIIHRAMFRVEEGENWYDRADDRYHSAADCGDLNHCPAPHDGFITLGDNNGAYDQANGLAAPVRADWVTGVARVRVPYLGYVRLIATGQADPGDVLGTTVAMRGVQVGSVGVGGVNGEAAPDERPIVSGGDVTGGAVG
ncbi:S26 family signal peptidase [Halorubrum sp. LN27]|uniref:S26 family signal peptidase n=1 Tax=Halorubrum sp. LN27 TaxID=2801032 RepID=UPI00190B00E4|nr:S26 family signal peptidase [Halorubrum sp. LN27]